MEVNKLYNENCLATMARMPENSIDMILTSPPYDDLRDYKGYDFDFEAIAAELFRVLKEGGRLVWIVADKRKNFNLSLTSYRQAIHFQDIGFLVNERIIWDQQTFTGPSEYYYHDVYEIMLVLSKGKPKTFNPIVDRVNVSSHKGAFGKNSFRLKNGEMKTGRERKRYSSVGKRYNIWTCKTAAQEKPCQALPHPAMFGLGLARDHVFSWSNPGDLVYDPMMGSGTTAKACIELDRNFVGSEISEVYWKDSCAEVYMLLHAANLQLRLF